MITCILGKSLQKFIITYIWYNYLHLVIIDYIASFRQLILPLSFFFFGVWWRGGTWEYDAQRNVYVWLYHIHISIIKFWCRNWAGLAAVILKLCLEISKIICLWLIHYCASYTHMFAWWRGRIKDLAFLTSWWKGASKDWVL